jgi:hypothetical protein
LHSLLTVRDLLGEWQAQLQLWLARTAGLDETTARTISFVVLVAASVVVAVLVLVLVVRIVSVVLGAIAYALCCRCLRKPAHAQVGNANNAAAKRAKAPGVMAR